MARPGACVSFLVAFVFVVSPMGCSWRSGVRDPGHSSREQVIERSKVAQPTWLSFVPEQVQWEGRHLRFVVVKRQLYDIKLGVIQAQSYAHEAFMRELHLHTLELTIQEVQAALSPAQRLLFQQLLTKLLADTLAKPMTVADLYFEQIFQRSDDRDLTYYDVYVLATVPLDAWLRFKDALRAKLRGHPLPIFRQMASRL